MYHWDDLECPEPRTPLQRPQGFRDTGRLEDYPIALPVNADIGRKAFLRLILRLA